MSVGTPANRRIPGDLPLHETRLTSSADRIDENPAVRSNRGHRPAIGRNGNVSVLYLDSLRSDRSGLPAFDLLGVEAYAMSRLMARKYDSLAIGKPLAGVLILDAHSLEWLRLPGPSRQQDQLRL